MCDEAVDHFESLQRLLAANLEDLMSVGGVGESRSAPAARLAESSILSAMCRSLAWLHRLAESSILERYV